MRGDAPPDAGVGGPLGQARDAGVRETGPETDDAVEDTALSRGGDPANECVLQVVAKAGAERLRVSPHRQTMKRGAGKLHGRDFLAGNNRRARAAVTCPSRRAASCAATFRPCAVMR